MSLAGKTHPYPGGLGQNEYCPQPLWQPPAREQAVLRSLGSVSFQSRDTETEVAVLQAIRMRCRESMSYGGDMYRTARALPEGRGNCLAIAEQWLGYSRAAGLDSYFLWDGGHAMALMRGPGHWWIADEKGFDEPGSRVNRGVVAKLSVENHRKLLDTVVQGSGGRAYIQNFEPLISDPSTPAWQPITGSLGDTETPYGNTTLMLPAPEAPLFISAYGDLYRYITMRPEKWKAYGSQIRHFIPSDWADIQTRKAHFFATGE